MGKSEQKVKEDRTYFFFGHLDNSCIDVQKALCRGYRASSVCELQVQGYRLSPGCVLYLQAESRCKAYHRLLTRWDRVAQSPGNSVPVLGRLMNVKSLESCMGNV